MARGIHRLSARKVETARSTGKVHYIADGGSLYLRVGQGDGRSWVYRYRDGTGLHELGLGSARTVTLAEARDRAQAIRVQRSRGIDPLATRHKQVPTFGEVVDRYITDHRAGWAQKHAQEWESTLAKLSLRVTPVDRIDTQAILRSVGEHWSGASVQGRRVIDRIRIVLDAAGAAGYRDATLPNPARWKGHIEHLLATRPKGSERNHHTAMPYRELPAFTERLRQEPGTAARALEFTILTAARAGEVVGDYNGKPPATWAEIDLTARLWRVPAERMKGGLAHEVPLSRAAVDLLTSLPGERAGAIFPGLHQRSMHYLLRDKLRIADVSVHGFRSAFATWAQENDVPRDLREMALSHVDGDRVGAAYARSRLVELRLGLMEQWGRFCSGAGAVEEGGNVVALAGRAV